MAQNAEHFDQLVSFTLYNDVHDNRVIDSNRMNDATWGQFVELILAEHAVCERKDGAKLIAPIRFLAADDPACQHAPFTEEEAKRGLGKLDDLKRDGQGNPYAWRGGSNVESWWMLPVDIDGQQSIAQAKAFFANYAYVAFTSYSHLKDGVTDKFRLFLLLKQPVVQDEFLKRREEILDWLGPIDRSSLSSSRGFYLPSCPKERLSLAKRWYNDASGCLDLMSFEPPIPKILRPSKPLLPSEHPILLELMREKFLGTYEDWWKVSVAMVSAGFTLDDFKQVTVNGMMREKDAHACEKQWKKALARVKRGGTFDVGYLYNLVGKDELKSRCDAAKVAALEQDIARLKKIVGDDYE